MHAVVASRRDVLAELCHRFQVGRLEVFGSAIREDFDPARSDVDLVVEFAPDAPKTFRHYFQFKEAVEALLGRPVDLLETGTLKNPYLRAEIERTKELLYAA